MPDVVRIQDSFGTKVVDKETAFSDGLPVIDEEDNVDIFQTVLYDFAVEYLYLAGGHGREEREDYRQY